MKILILILFPITTFSQVLFTPSQQKALSSYTYHCLDGQTENNGKYWEANSISKIDLNAAFSVEVWQFLPERQADRMNILDIYSRDTIENYFRIRLDGNLYPEAAWVNSATTHQIDAGNEAGIAPKAYSGTLEVKDWYHIVFTWDGSASSGYSMYINGLEVAVFDYDGNGSATRPDVYGDYLFRCWNHFRSGPVRFFQKELSAAEATTLWNGGEPLLSTSISALKLEYDHSGDTWSINKWVIPDDATSPNNAESVGFTEADRVPVQDYEPNQTRSYIIPPGRFFVVDEYLGHNYFNQENSLSREVGPIGSYNQGPVVWYDTSANQTIISVNDRVGLGGNLQGMVMVYDHESNTLFPRAKNGNSVGGSNNGIVDSHQGQSVISIGGNVITGQERQHISPIYYNYGTISSGVVQFNGLGGIGSALAYPCFQVAGSTVYLYGRDSAGDGPNDIQLHTSTNNGASWSSATSVCAIEVGDALYNYHCYHPSRFAFLCRRRDLNDSGEYTQSFFIQSDDGINFYNADSSYSSVATISEAAFSANFSVHQVDSIGIGQASRGLFNSYGNGMFVFFQPNYTAGTNTIESKTLYYAADKDTFSTKTVATTFEGYPIHISGDEWVVIGKDLADFPGDGPLKIHRTTDFFDSLSYDSTLSGQWEVGRFRVTANALQAEEIVIVCQVTKLNGTNIEGVNDYLGIYIMPKL